MHTNRPSGSPPPTSRWQWTWDTRTIKGGGGGALVFSWTHLQTKRKTKLSLSPYHATVKREQWSEKNKPPKQNGREQISISARAKYKRACCAPRAIFVCTPSLLLSVAMLIGLRGGGGGGRTICRRSDVVETDFPVSIPRRSMADGWWLVKLICAHLRMFGGSFFAGFSIFWADPDRY